MTDPARTQDFGRWEDEGGSVRPAAPPKQRETGAMRATAAHNLRDRCDLLVTPRVEYVTCDSVCVGVRDRASGEWFEPHHALGGFLSLVPSASRRAGEHWDVQVEMKDGAVRAGPLVAHEKASEALFRMVAHRVRRMPVAGAA